MATTTVQAGKENTEEKAAYDAIAALIIRGHLAPGSRIVKAIERGDPEVAEHTIHDYMAYGADRYAEVMKSVGERGTW
jgi:DNA-binding GntR family transcriptional regulator